MEWWQRFNLVDDPFERTKGIAEEEISTLVIETRTFRKYRGRSEKPHTLFGKAILLHGAYGSGKTTLFYFLKNSCRDKNIWCRVIRLNGTFKDTKDIEKEFNMKLYFEITREIKEEVNNLDILTAFIKHKDEHKVSGYLIFIDELHKNLYYEASLDFLKNLQGRLEEIFQHVSLGLIVAGHNNWKNRIERNPVYSGTFDLQDVMEDITLEEAEKILCARLKEYSTQKTPKEIITKAAVHKIYSQLPKEEKTPRKLFNKVRSVFQDMPESTIKVTPTEVEAKLVPNKLNAIEDRLLRASAIHRKLLQIKRIYGEEKSEEVFKIR